MALNNFTDNGNRNTKLYGGALYVTSCCSALGDAVGYPNVVSWNNTFVENSAQWWV